MEQFSSRGAFCYSLFKRQCVSSDQTDNYRQKLIGTNIYLLKRSQRANAHQKKRTVLLSASVYGCNIRCVLGDFMGFS